ncbi:PIN domain-containing protein [Tardiphaga sp. vice352]|uniref:PIN domain-containing protein n=1 Tax=unclassified Tardiphaga TaxID=2631404 RepID=UPI0011638B02|nr:MULTISPECIES: PIN domain-containing protein [unclassified Tardiphaga]QDM18733.1 PIN domain-containing protein [Tardiphaga sp. vice278]QDM23729.1 PIN domain-containing protein [Tardiphaga sp. vice154]QDM28952.1 PIN domain-containing protein [Tardiphaga sp. vice304]QDM34051.1 PIN domain-containing protein [Tardiphaga sp. vice352]
MSGSFFDSNALLYLAAPESQKIERVRSLLYKGGFISVQVLNEMKRVSRRKSGMSWSEIHRLLNTVREFVKVEPLTLETHEAGLRLAERYGFAIYDSFIVAAALAAECETLWSEDMQHGMLVDNRLRIANPFAP